MDLRIKTQDGRRVRAYYNRGELGGITLSVYDENMIGHPIATLGYDNKKRKMVLLLRNIEAENIEISRVLRRNERDLGYDA